jgi:NADH-quinone oxidoreductase subunit L
MTLPLIVLAVLSVIGGYIGVPEALGGHHWLSGFLSPVVKSSSHTLSHGTEYMLMGISTALVAVSILFAWLRFKSYKVEGEAAGLGKLLENKWYVDELYHTIIIRPLKSTAAFFTKWIEAAVVDGAVNGVGKLVQFGGRQMRLLQSGQVGAYVLLMVIGTLIIFIIQFFL